MRMIRHLTGGLLAVAVLAAGAGAALAHHGWSQYDESREVVFNGTVREVAYEHPHVALRVEASDRTWLAILPPPTRATRIGLTRDALRVGMEVRLAGHPHRSVTDELRALRIVVDGRTFQLR